MRMSRVLQHGVDRITQGFKSTHKGVDLGKSHVSEPIIAHSAGIVTFCQTGQKNNKGSTGNASYGNCIKLDHGGGFETLYAHLAAVKVKHGERVSRGQVIGTMGNTGNSYGTHLHFEVRKAKSRIDPAPYLDADLPIAERIPVKYRAYVGGRWLPWVTDHGLGADGYAGIYGKPITALQIRPERGAVRYRVKQNGAWLPWVTSKSSWAGVRGVPVQAVEITADGYTVQYQVTDILSSEWQDWVYDGGTAGGAVLDGIRIGMAVRP